jgi:hypothetical protein
MSFDGEKPLKSAHSVSILSHGVGTLLVAPGADALR